MTTDTLPLLNDPPTEQGKTRRPVSDVGLAGEVAEEEAGHRTFPRTLATSNVRPHCIAGIGWD
jgi:hypothetical protein